MKFTVPKDELSNGLRKVLSVVSPRTTLPALNNVLLEAKDDTVQLTTTDLEVCMQTAVPATITEEGSTTLPARKLGQIINVLPKGEVIMETQENENTTLSCEQAFFRIVGLSPDEFPQEDVPEGDWAFTLPAGSFRAHLDKVTYARSDEETQQMLNGVLLSIRDGMLTTAATDGRRLALLETSLNAESVSDGDVILPPKAVAEIQKNMGTEGDIHISLSESRAKFTFDSSIITTKLIEGTYPNYRQVIPDNLSRSAVIPKKEFEEVLNRVALVVSDTSASVRLDFEPSRITVNATSSEIGESKEPVEVSYEGEAVGMSFNPDYLAEPLKQMESDQVVLQFNDEYTPISLTGDEGFLYVLMPMRT